MKKLLDPLRENESFDSFAIEVAKMFQLVIKNEKDSSKKNLIK